MTLDEHLTTLYAAEINAPTKLQTHLKNFATELSCIPELHEEAKARLKQVAGIPQQRCHISYRQAEHLRQALDQAAAT